VAQQLKLTVLAIRTCALPLGRGALTLGTLRPLPTEPLHIPPLCLGERGTAAQVQGCLMPVTRAGAVRLALSSVQCCHPCTFACLAIHSTVQPVASLPGLYLAPSSNHASSK
jgi:hypothetical protein